MDSVVRLRSLGAGILLLAAKAGDADRPAAVQPPAAEGGRRKPFASLRTLVSLGMAGGLLGIAAGFVVPAEHSRLKIWLPFAIFDAFALIGFFYCWRRPDSESKEQIAMAAATVAAIWLPLPIGAAMHAFAHAIRQETDMPPDHFSATQIVGWYAFLFALIAYGIVCTRLYFRSLDRGGGVLPKRLILIGWGVQLLSYIVCMMVVLVF